ncbi:signal transducer and activator of transcription C-like [Haliotis rubra]|uniref:signal transducer and activator of transcription C-like n=1 Tax=Haliotis rubra TaxID=36100 RepID=UPI001EE55A8D|nr:signal transducer and activator of transcription C-like [Haliotis rubra]
MLPHKNTQALHNQQREARYRHRTQAMQQQQRQQHQQRQREERAEQQRRARQVQQRQQLHQQQRPYQDLLHQFDEAQRTSMLLQQNRQRLYDNGHNHNNSSSDSKETKDSKDVNDADVDLDMSCFHFPALVAFKSPGNSSNFWSNQAGNESSTVNPNFILVTSPYAGMTLMKQDVDHHSSRTSDLFVSSWWSAQRGDNGEFRQVCDPLPNF